MGQIIKFQFPHSSIDSELGEEVMSLHDIRVLPDPENPASFMVVATDLAKILRRRDGADLARLLDDDEKGTHNVRTLGGQQEALTIREPGVYRVLAVARKRENDPAYNALIARFQRWLFHDVLPAIRQTGSYSIHQEQAQPVNQGVTADLLREARLCADMFPALGDAGRQTFLANIVNHVSGQKLMPLPVVERPAVEMSVIAKSLGITQPGKISHLGRIATAAGLRTPEFGEVRLTVAPGDKQVEQWHWYQPEGVDAVTAAYHGHAARKAAA